MDDMTMNRSASGGSWGRSRNAARSAAEVYEAAKAAGHVASLLDQERPNIFTQSVANIEPGVGGRASRSLTSRRSSTRMAYSSGCFRWSLGRGTSPAAGVRPAPMTPWQD